MILPPVPHDMVPPTEPRWPHSFGVPVPVDHRLVTRADGFTNGPWPLGQKG